MPFKGILRIFFSPAIAIARVGGSLNPMEAFTWAEDPRMFGAGQTIIQPTVSLEVLPDGSLRPYLPRHLRLKDHGKIRPVCPFLELWAEHKRSRRDGTVVEPLTPAILRAYGLRLDSLMFEIEAVNRKAARRTQDEACSFGAKCGPLKGSDHEKHELRAWSLRSGGPPLVSRSLPITLGWFQVIRPREVEIMDVDLKVIRVRFTPGKGEVYGPIGAKEGIGNSRAPSDPRMSKSAKPRKHEIVPPENRILNSGTSWENYNYTEAKYPYPDPPETYDGEDDSAHNKPNESSNDSWGVVDDTCEAVIIARLDVANGGCEARARIWSGPPDYAPDRRPFHSIADDFADRDPESVPAFKKAGKTDPAKVDAAILDLFRRIFESSSLINLDMIRNKGVSSNTRSIRRKVKGFPLTTPGSMTHWDAPLSELARTAYISVHPSRGDETGEGADLVRTELAEAQHQKLAEPEELISFLRQSRSRLREIVRPPYRWLDELNEKPEKHGPHELRDPRWPHDTLYDMRMPPYIRDSDTTPLSLTRRQWDMLWYYVELLQPSGDSLMPEWSPLAAHVRHFVNRRKKR